MAVIFDGKKFAESKLVKLAKRVGNLRRQGITPTLASVFLSADPGSALYTKIKGKTARATGIDFLSYPIADPKNIEAVVDLVARASADPKVQGVLAQKPAGQRDFAPHVWARIVSAINPQKDVDGLSPQNLGLLAMGAPSFLPATVAAIMSILKAGQVKVGGRHIVIVGSSEILGKPLAAFLLLTEKRATVTLLNRQTPNLASYTKLADILISATGHTGLIGGQMVKPGAAVIDVGAPKGDVRTAEVVKKVGFLSPVPGGVGPVTVACLLENTVLAAERLQDKV